jgi:glutamine amidotransferase
MIVIVDYGMGNLGSIQNMFKHLGIGCKISGAIHEIEAASKLVLAGVGSFDDGMERIRECGLDTVLTRKVLELHAPVLGICLGMQLFTQESEEGWLPGLGWVQGRTVRFDPSRIGDGVKIPHMGWNTVEIQKPSSLLQEMDDPSRFYFVHSYHVVCERPEDILGTTTHGYEFVSAIERGNVCGVQFHPEKSHRFGMRLLQRFAEQGVPCSEPE